MRRRWCSAVRPPAVALGSTYVARILKLTSLAPDLVEAVLTVEEPDDLSLRHLTNELPLDWGEQRRRCE